MSYRIHISPAGPSLAVMSEKGTEVYIHSRVNPAQEKPLTVPELRSGTTIIVLGLGLGYHVREIFSRYPDSRYFIIEREQGLAAETISVQGSSFFPSNTVIFEGTDVAELESGINDTIITPLTGIFLC